MKRAFCVWLTIALLTSAAVAKDPAIEHRKLACRKISLFLEQNTGWNTYVRIAPGKSQDVMQFFPGADAGKLIVLDGGASIPTQSFVRFKREVIDTIVLSEPYKSQLKELGFKAVQLKMAPYHSDSFPKGIWDIPLQ